MSIRKASIVFVVPILALVAVVGGAVLSSRRVLADEGWYVEFFDNQTLSGSPVRTQVHPWIGSDWGTGAPVPGMSADHFSARWTRSLELEDDGAYQFCAMADDGARIWIDNVLVLDEWHGNNGIAYCSSQRALHKGEHQVQVDYYEDGGEALIYVWWEEVEPISRYIPVVVPAPTQVILPSIAVDAPAPFDGWYGEYFGNRSFAGKPDMVRLDPAIGFEWGVGSPTSEQDYYELFSVRWRRAVQFERGTYRFCAMADDAVRIWVDDVLVVNEWHANHGTVFCGTQRVTEGVHKVHVEYCDDWGEAFIYVWWEREPAVSWEPVDP
jgi:hypothetical protein